MKKRASKLDSLWRYPSYIGMAFLCCAILVSLVFFHQNTAAQDYPVQGFDVSHHQGDIDWKKISPKHYQFVYLKATEGGDYQDDKFQDYWLSAHEQGLRIGAYHFYRLCRDGDIQAQNFIQTVPNKSYALPPVIDLEYDSNCINHFSKEQLLKQIQIMHDRLQQHYGKQPIFYTSKNFYNIILLNQFKQTPIWIREYQGSPELKDKRPWTFWQKSNQGQIKGIHTIVDLNVFHGSEQDWNIFLEKNQLLSFPKKN
ncbi:GH25 family lysozyme [Acinetobacter sp. ANC 4648]|uniref:glycoside hydrolase family 25 protein n=1 Tax=Acinetobacter sp. ANC 4648 TaxID=1977875 RepID=UPI000A33DE38|nr:GH25 family lysozyme [Acinetobacter sp. ANC 4648]OTG81174.1 lysozyme [Acinetobacter sp. ANC 4648]